MLVQRHNLGCCCEDEAEACGIMPFYVLDHRDDATHLSGETFKCKGNK